MNKSERKEMPQKTTSRRPAVDLPRKRRARTGNREGRKKRKKDDPEFGSKKEKGFIACFLQTPGHQEPSGGTFHHDDGEAEDHSCEFRGENGIRDLR